MSFEVHIFLYKKFTVIMWKGRIQFRISELLLSGVKILLQFFYGFKVEAFFLYTAVYDNYEKNYRKNIISFAQSFDIHFLLSLRKGHFYI